MASERSATREEEGGARRKGSLINMAAVLSSMMEEREDVAVRPRRVWRTQRSLDELLAQRAERRARLGDESDFPETFRMPFMENVLKKLKVLEAEDG